MDVIGMTNLQRQSSRAEAEICFMRRWRWSLITIGGIPGTTQ